MIIVGLIRIPQKLIRIKVHVYMLYEAWTVCTIHELDLVLAWKIMTSARATSCYSV